MPRKPFWTRPSEGKLRKDEITLIRNFPVGYPVHLPYHRKKPIPLTDYPDPVKSALVDEIVAKVRKEYGQGSM